MKHPHHLPRVLAAVVAVGLVAAAGLSHAWQAAPATAAPGAAAAAPPAGMPPVIDPHNVYSEIGASRLAATVRDDPARVYVPNLRSNDVTVIDQATLKVLETFKVGESPQHVVPSWDLRTLWVANNAERRISGSVTPIDPRTGGPGTAIAVDDPYNMYFTPDGRS